MVRLERLELPTPWFEAKCSIQLSYSRSAQSVAIFLLRCAISLLWQRPLPRWRPCSCGAELKLLIVLKRHSRKNPSLLAQSVRCYLFDDSMIGNARSTPSTRGLNMSHTQLRLFVDSRFISPYAMSAYVALQEKELPFEISTLDLGAGEQHAESFAHLSLTHRVPMLVQERFSLSESSAITEYIDEVFTGTPLYPRQPRHRATARQIQAWLRSDLTPIRQERSTEVVFYGVKQPALSSAALAAATTLFAAVESLLGADKLELFDDWCIADTDLALMLNRLILNGDAVPARLAAYAAHQWRRPSVQQWVMQTRPPL
jgi:glutathione S-transferase